MSNFHECYFAKASSSNVLKMCSACPIFIAFEISIPFFSNLVNLPDELREPFEIVLPFSQIFHLNVLRLPEKPIVVISGLLRFQMVRGQLLISGSKRRA